MDSNIIYYIPAVLLVLIIYLLWPTKQANAPLPSPQETFTEEGQVQPQAGLFDFETKSSSPSPLSKDRRAEIILYYAMWCGITRQFIPEWEKFEKYAADHLKHIKVSSVRCEDGHEATCAQKGVKGYPTVILYLKDGQEVMFQGNRTQEGLTEFIRQYVK